MAKVYTPKLPDKMIIYNCKDCPNVDFRLGTYYCWRGKRRELEDGGGWGIPEWCGLPNKIQKKQRYLPRPKGVSLMTDTQKLEDIIWVVSFRKA